MLVSRIVRRIRSLARRIGWDRNPLRRRSDRIEDALRMAVTASLLITPLLAWQVGESRYRDAVDEAGPDRQVRQAVQAAQAVQAVLQDDAIRYARPTDSARPPLTFVPARWSAPDHTICYGYVVADAEARAGSTGLIWADTHGARARSAVLRSPLREALEAGALVLLVITVCVTRIRRATMRRIHHRRMARWQLEWLGVEPQWSGRR